jgi:hypothetical protein
MRGAGLGAPGASCWCALLTNNVFAEVVRASTTAYRTARFASSSKPRTIPALRKNGCSRGVRPPASALIVAGIDQTPTSRRLRDGGVQWQVMERSSIRWT